MDRSTDAKAFKPAATAILQEMYFVAGHNDY
jgi:hypothetical protein